MNPKISKVDLSKFQNRSFRRGAPLWKELGWLIISALFFNHSLAIINSIKVFLLRLFGAKIGQGVLIKPSVSIKFPWKLTIGDHVWIGKKVWIDNLDQVLIQDQICISQGAMLLSGNHDYTKATFDLIVKPITIKSGAWIGAKAVVCPGITVHSHAVLSVGSVATKDLEPYTIYQGIPAIRIRDRIIEMDEKT